MRSSIQNYGTPARAVEQLERELGRPFDLDVCAEPWNTKAPRFISQAENGLTAQWGRLNWCNPPYSDQAGAELESAVAAEHRRLWRCLALCVKAKLELVSTGITTFEDEFLAHIVTPDGSTVGRWLRPQLARAYDTGKMPSLLPAHEDGAA